MKVVILAGGLGTRLAEETEIKPKPMVEIGGKPIIWHIMKHYAHYGFKEFYVSLGYKGEYIKKYFLEYTSVQGNLTVNLATGEHKFHKKSSNDWIIHLIDTGLDSNTGGRVRRLKPWLEDETFMVTYGDGVSNVNLHELLDFHKSHGLCGTVSAVRPPARFGGLIFEGKKVKKFTEKSQTAEGWINGGFLVFEPQIFDYLDNDNTGLEADTLERLATNGQLAAYQHFGFWQCMDTVRDRMRLNEMWDNNQAKWKIW